MGRTTDEERLQIFCLRVVCVIGIVFFFLCLLPFSFDTDINDSTDWELLIPHNASRIAVIAASFPLLCDYVHDASLPHRLTYPRALILLGMVVPNAMVLILDSYHHSQLLRMSICFKFASDQLLASGLVAYISGEVVSKRLLVLLVMVQLWCSVSNFFFVMRVLITPAISLPLSVGIMLVTLLLFIVMVLWLVNDMRRLDQRRKMFLITYTIAVCGTGALNLLSYIIITSLKLGAFLQDVSLLIQILIASGVMTITSRMAQHDAITAMVITS
jgi:hypothetical protein